MPAILTPALGFLGEAMTVLRWYVEVGQPVQRGAPLVELTVEKAISVLEAEHDGVLLACYAPPGAVLLAGAPLGWIGQSDETLPALTADEPAPLTSVAELTPPAGKNTPSPQQIRSYLQKSLRPWTARRMRHSWQQAPKVDLLAEVDFSAVIAHREALKRTSQPRPSYNVYIAHAAAQVFAHDFPEFNLNWIDDAPTALDGVHIGMAVERDTALLTIALRHVQTASLVEIEKQFRKRLRQVLRLQLAPQEMYGNSLTISNLGAFDVVAFTPLLNPPEVFILGVGAVREAVVFEAGRPRPQPQCTLCLSFDHRAIDGAPASRILQAIKRRLEAYS